MITGRDIYDFLKKFLGHPIFKFLYPFLVSGIVILFVEDGKSMSYLVSKTVKVSSTLTKEDRLILKKDKEEVLYRNNISFFNDGDELIDNSDFINFDNITVSKKGVDIKGVRVLKKSRESLSVDVYQDSIKSDVFHLRLINNEVFEKNDVVVIKVLYSGNQNGEWYSSSRIKGIPNGLRKSKIKPNEATVITWVNIILIGIALIIVFRLILFKIYKKKFIIRNVELYPILTVLGIAGVLYYEYFHDQKILEHLMF